MALLLSILSLLQAGAPAQPLPPVIKVDLPKTGQAPYPLLVIAPAKRYALNGPIFEELALRASDMGYYVVRFDWPFYTQNREPSLGFAEESQVLTALLRSYKSRREIDPQRVVLAAKSLGSQIAMKRAWQEASAILLLTPNCSPAAPFTQIYQPLLNYQKPLHILISATDPYCPVEDIYQAMRYFKNNTTLYTLAGDHNFALIEALTDKNFQAALLSAENWLEIHRGH